MSKKDKESKKQTSAQPEVKKLSNKAYENELFKLQAELCKLQEWVVHKGLRAIVIFEGRDAAGKGGVIKRISERVSPRVFRVTALPAPSERQKTQIKIQRYMEHFPAAGEVILFDRSWYNVPNVERVMGFCTEQEYQRFMQYVPWFEKAIVDSGIILIKYWFEVSQDIQTKRFEARIEDPRKHWKLSPMDLESHKLWYDYSRAKDAMFAVTDTEWAPWHVVNSDNKKRARLNCISHLLGQIPYEELPFNKPKLPKRQDSKGYKEPEYSYNYIPEIF